MRIVLFLGIYLFNLTFLCAQVSEKKSTCNDLFYDGSLEASLSCYEALDANELTKEFELMRVLAYLRLGLIEKAETQLTDTGIQEQGLSQSEKVLYNRVVGALRMNRGRTDQAMEFYEKALDVSMEAFGEHSLVTAAAENDLGVAHWNQGNNEQAMNFFSRALVIRSEKLPQDHPEIAACYNNLGLVTSTTDPDEALNFYKKARDIYIDRFGKTHQSVANTTNNIAFAYQEKAFNDRALDAFMESKDILEEMGMTEHPNLAFVLSSIGQVQEKRGYPTEAVDYQKKALTIYKKNYGEKHPEVASTYNLIGVQQKNQGEFLEALTQFQKAIQSNLPAGGSSEIKQITPVASSYQPRTLLVSLLLKAQTLEQLHYEKTLRRDHLRWAFGQIQSCDTLIEEIRRGLTSERDKLELGTLAADVYACGVRLATRLSEVTLQARYFKEEAFYFSEKSKAAVLLEAISDAKAKSFANIPNEVLEEEIALKAEIAFLEQKISQHPEKETSFRDELFTLTNKYLDFVDDLGKKYPEYFNLKYNISIARIPDIQKSLPSDLGVVSYFQDPSVQTLYVFLITKDKYELVDVAVDPQYDKYITGFRNAIRYDLKEYIAEFGFKLYQQLFPLRIPSEVSKLLIIPEGRQGVLPFEALVTKKVKDPEMEYVDFPYLARQFATSYAFSATLAFQAKEEKKEHQSSGVLLCAPVEFGGEVADLPATEKECATIQTLFKEKGRQADLYLRNEANESLLKSAMIQKYSMLHLSTHGEVNETSPELSNIKLFTSSVEDGKLFTGEIYNLQFDADLVTLSACQTGLGKISKGEGIIGLSRALLFSGADNLVVSYWKVADESTSNLMIKFYSEVLNSPQVLYAPSLRKAKLALMQDPTTANPYYWAPFVLIGF